MLKTNAMIPEIARNILVWVQETDPKAIIAGGYLRDLDNGREPKDIDVFVTPGKYRDVGDFLTAKGFEFLEGGESAEVDSTVVEQSSWRDTKFNITVNVIACLAALDPIERFEKFDFGICQIAFDGKDIYTTDAYELDKRLCRFTLVKATGNDFMYSIRRYRRFVKKYDDWPMIYEPAVARQDFELVDKTGKIEI